MNNNGARHFTWECDYANRSPAISALSTIISRLGGNIHPCPALYVNNNIYNKEFFIQFEFNEKQFNEIEVMNEEMMKCGSKIRYEITFKDLNYAHVNGQFNMAIIPDNFALMHSIDSIFFFKDRSDLSKEIPQKLNFNKNQVFISHSTLDKPYVEKFISYLNGQGINVWYDKVNISLGENIVDKIQEGISHAAQNLHEFISI